MNNQQFMCLLNRPIKAPARKQLKINFMGITGKTKLQEIVFEDAF